MNEGPSTASELEIAKRDLPMPESLAPVNMTPAMALWFDPVMFDRARQMATYLARAEGVTPRHLINKYEACFAVVERSLTWGLSPFAVAMCTFQTPGGGIGFEGKLCQAILEVSGHLDGPVTFEHYGQVTLKHQDGTEESLRSIDARVEMSIDGGSEVIAEKTWDAVMGKFEIRQSKKDARKEYAARTWTREDAKGLGVMIRARVKGEENPREWPFDLEQAWPLNSTLWATDPRTQICYTGVRRFCNVAAPGIFLGVPFDDEAGLRFGPDEALDVTPARPIRERLLAEDEARHQARVAEAKERAAEREMDAAAAAAAGNERMPDTPAERGDEEESELDAAGRAMGNVVNGEEAEGPAEKKPPKRKAMTKKAKPKSKAAKPAPAKESNETVPEPPAGATEADSGDDGEENAQAEEGTPEAPQTAPPAIEVADEFWDRRNYKLGIAQTESGLPNWQRYQTLILTYVAAAPEEDCLTKLRDDNAEGLRQLGKFSGPALGVVNERINERIATLEQIREGGDLPE